MMDDGPISTNLIRAAEDVRMAQQPVVIMTQGSSQLPSTQPSAEPGRASIPTSQRPVSPTQTYHRVLAIVPLAGSGTHDDPIRPMFAPAPSAVPPSRSGIIAYQHQITDDGKMAIVEFVAPTRAAFAELFASQDPRVKYFEVGQHPQADIEAAFKQVKASFDFNNFVPLPVR